ncbi:hypothetical protein D030_2039A, partial [Vibrio parahaemolyticus AQ3810]
MVRFG